MMNNTSGHLAILAGAGVAAVLVSVFMTLGQRGGTATSAQVPVVVTVPQRPSAPPPAAAPAIPRPAPAAIAGDPASLSRALQRELKRVGCYDGEASGIWSAPSRAAMKSFTDRVNATLPVDAPDQILLALVQAHRGQACGAPCKPGELQGADGRCLPEAIAGKVEKIAGQPEADMAEKREPSVKAVPVPVPASRMRAPNSPPPVARAEALPPAPQTGQPQSDARHGRPVPALGVYERRVRRAARRKPKPPAIVRSLIRSLKRAASVW